MYRNLPVLSDPVRAWVAKRSSSEPVRRCVHMFARLRKRRALIIGLLTVLALTVSAVAPWVLWHLQADRPLDIVVVDKTVAKADYRKHAGLLWVLRHEKIVQRSTGRPLALDRDYAGYQYEPDGQPRIVPIPDRPSDFTLSLIHISEPTRPY